MKQRSCLSICGAQSRQRRVAGQLRRNAGLTQTAGRSASQFAIKAIPPVYTSAAEEFADPP
jgi:hypothetical protein